MAPPYRPVGKGLPLAPMTPPPGAPRIPKGAAKGVASQTAKNMKAAPVTHPQLPPTSGKTTVPARTVTPHPAPNTTTKAATVTPKRPTRPAAVLTPDQTAAKAVTAALAPLYGAQKTAAVGQNTAITNLTKAVIQALGGSPAQIGGEYDRAIGQQTNLSNAAADALRQANPNTQDQALLSAINAPAEQQAQLAAGNNAAFNGVAAVGQYVGGVLPASSLQAQKLAAMGMAHLQPVIEGLRGQQSLSAALTGQRADRAKIDAMRPDLIQKYSAAYTAQQQKQQYLDYVAQKFGMTSRSTVANLTGVDPVTGQPTYQAQKTQTAADAKVRAAQDKAIAAARKTAASDAKPNSSLSRAQGVIVDSNNNKIFGPDGKPQILPGFKAGPNGTVVKTGKAAGKPKANAEYPNLTKSQVVHLRAGIASAFNGVPEQHDANNKVVAKALPKVNYQAAIDHAVSAGYSRAAATRMANRFYMPGQRGRPAKPKRDTGFRSAKLTPGGK